MLGFQYVWSQHQNPTSARGVGNAMEIAAGIAYAASLSCANLPSHHSLEFPTEDSRGAWAEAWHAFSDLGLQPIEMSIPMPEPA